MRRMALPLTDEEAEKRALEDDAEEGELEPRFAEKEIDTSALGKAEPPVLKEVRP